MFEKVSYIELSGRKYPIKCDILVLEKIQNEFGDLSKFENSLSGFVPEVDEAGEYKRNEKGFLIGIYKTPDIRILNKALCWMVQEGMEIEAEEKNEKAETFNGKKLLRGVDIPPSELGKRLHTEFSRCFERKNGATTQRMEETENLTK